MEAQAIKAGQSALDHGAKFVNEARGNEVFREKWFLHNPFYTDGGHVPNGRSGQGTGSGQIHTAQRGQAATNAGKQTRRKQLWLRLGRAALYRQIAFGRPSNIVEAQELFEPVRIENPRYGRWQICATPN
jgi:hypothetical protein